MLKSTVYKDTETVIASTCSRDTDSQTDRQSVRQTDRQLDRQTDRDRQRQTETDRLAILIRTF